MISGGGQRWLSVKASLDSPGPRSGFTCLAMAAAGLHSPRPGWAAVRFATVNQAYLAREARPAAARLHLLVPRSAGPRFAGEAVRHWQVPRPSRGPGRGAARLHSLASAVARLHSLASATARLRLPRLARFHSSRPARAAAKLHLPRPGCGQP